MYITVRKGKADNFKVKVNNLVINTHEKAFWMNSNTKIQKIIIMIAKITLLKNKFIMIDIGVFSIQSLKIKGELI